MAIPVALRGDFKASQLRGLARKTKDGPQARRLLAVAAIYDGATRTEAAKIGGVGLRARGASPCETTPHRRPIATPAVSFRSSQRQPALHPAHGLRMPDAAPWRRHLARV